MPRYVNSRDDAVLYNPNLVLPELLRRPGFSTIHDFLYFPQPQKYAWREYKFFDTLYFRWAVPRTLRKTSRTHLVSQAALCDARALFPRVPVEHFRVIPHGIDAQFWGIPSAFPEHRDVSRPYILYVGSQSQRKNLPVLLRAFREFLHTHPSHQLVIISSRTLVEDPAVPATFQMLPRESYRILPDVDRPELRAWYQHADFFVYPSLYEGFGIPPLEAQASSCPVICSSATSLPEVVGSSALLFDPHAPEELLRQMERLSDDAERGRLVEEGLRNIRRFSWAKTAEQFLALADEVYGLATLRHS